MGLYSTNFQRAIVLTCQEDYERVLKYCQPMLSNEQVEEFPSDVNLDEHDGHFVDNGGSSATYCAYKHFSSLPASEQDEWATKHCTELGVWFDTDASKLSLTWDAMGILDFTMERIFNHVAAHFPDIEMMCESSVSPEYLVAHVGNNNDGRWEWRKLDDWLVEAQYMYYYADAEGFPEWNEAIALDIHHPTEEMRQEYERVCAKL